MSDDIQVQMGGDVGSYVAAITAAANSNQMLIGSTQKVSDTLRHQAAGHDLAETAGKKHKTALDGLGASGISLEGTLQKTMAAAKGFIAGWIGLEGVQKVLSLIGQHLDDISRKSAALGLASREMDAAAKAVANQLGGAAKFDQAKTRIREIMGSGGLSSVGQAEGVAIAGNVNWGNLGDDRERAMVRTAAEFIGRKGLGVSEGGDLIEVLGKMGAKNPEDVKRISEQIFASFRGSQSTSFSGWVTGLKKAAPEMAAAGATNETILSSMIQARAGKANEEQAAELNRQLLMALGREPVQKALAKEAGLSREKWLGQGFDTRMEQFGAWVSKYGASPKGKMLLGDILNSEELGRTMAMFTPAGLAGMASSRKQLADVTPGLFDQEAAAWAQTDLAKREQLQARGTLAGIDVTSQLATGGEILEQAKKLRDRIMTGEAVPELDSRTYKNLKNNFWWQGDEREVQSTAAAMLEGRGRRMYEAAKGRGDIVENYTPDPEGGPGITNYQTQGSGRQILEAYQAAGGLSPGLWAAPNAAEFGKVDRMLELLERATNALDRMDQRDQQPAGTGYNPFDGGIH